MAHSQSRFDKVSGAKFIGFYFGRFFGLIIGAFIGLEIAKGIGVIIGALSFYFLGRWIGSKIGIFTGRIIVGKLPVADSIDKVVQKPSPSKRLIVIIYAAILPFLIVILAQYFNLNDIQFVGLPAEWLEVRPKIWTIP